MQIERVRISVSEGGHDVPVDKIVDRHRWSFDELAWFAGRVDDCYIFDNSTGDPALLAARISRGPLWQFAPFPDDLATVLTQAEIDILPSEQ